VKITHNEVNKIIQKIGTFTNSLVVGHTDNIPAIVKKITGNIVSITDDDYDNLFIITVKQTLFFSTKKMVKTTYGAPSP
ncbi:MAG TPA: hypothetical protein VKH37_11175, partial [Ferruginibacter sp.]|nr:hypothetical protein [Ferruginibacter sp.]